MSLLSGLKRLKLKKITLKKVVHNVEIGAVVAAGVVGAVAVAPVVAGAIGAGAAHLGAGSAIAGIGKSIIGAGKAIGGAELDRLKKAAHQTADAVDKDLQGIGSVIARGGASSRTRIETSSPVMAAGIGAPSNLPLVLLAGGALALLFVIRK